MKQVIVYFAKMFSNSSEVSSTRFVFVTGFYITIICGFTMCFATLYNLFPDKEKCSYIAPIIGAIFGGMVAIITSLSAIKGYVSKQESASSKNEKSES